MRATEETFLASDRMLNKSSMSLQGTEAKAVLLLALYFVIYAFATVWVLAEAYADDDMTGKVIGIIQLVLLVVGLGSIMLLAGHHRRAQASPMPLSTAGSDDSSNSTYSQLFTIAYILCEGLGLISSSLSSSAGSSSSLMFLPVMAGIVLQSLSAAYLWSLWAICLVVMVIAQALQAAPLAVPGAVCQIALSAVMLYALNCPNSSELGGKLFHTIRARGPNDADQQAVATKLAADLKAVSLLPFTSHCSALTS